MPIGTYTIPTTIEAKIQGECHADADSILFPSAEEATAALEHKATQDSFYEYGCVRKSEVAISHQVIHHETLFCPVTEASALYHCSFSW